MRIKKKSLLWLCVLFLLIAHILLAYQAIPESVLETGQLKNLPRQSIILGYILFIMLFFSVIMPFVIGTPFFFIIAKKKSNPYLSTYIVGLTISLIFSFILLKNYALITG